MWVCAEYLGDKMEVQKIVNIDIYSIDGDASVDVYTFGAWHSQPQPASSSKPVNIVNF